MKRHHFLIAAFLLFIVAGVVQSCQSTRSATTSKLLRFNLEKGKGYDYEMIINTDQDKDGKQTQADITTYYSMDVTEDDGKTKTLTATFERFKMTVGMDGLNVTIDSDKPLPNLGILGKENMMKNLNALLGAIRGRRFTMKVNAEGKVEEITGFKDMAATISDSLHLEGEAKEKMMEGFNKQFNENDTKSKFERAFYIFPDKVVKVGDTWQKSSAAGSEKYTSVYTVKEIEGDMVTIGEVTKVSGDGAKGMNGEITGTLTVDSRSGLVVNGDQDIDMKATENGKTMSIKGKTKIKGKAR